MTDEAIQPSVQKLIGLKYSGTFNKNRGGLKQYFIQPTAVPGLQLLLWKSVTEKSQMSSTNLQFHNFIFWVSVLDPSQAADFDHVYNRQ